jgi:hypothetical protein
LPKNVEDLLHPRGLDISHETVRFRWHRFGPIWASEIRKRRIGGMKSRRWRGYLDGSWWRPVARGTTSGALRITPARLRKALLPRRETGRRR